jgi:hypothetical protein
MSHWDYGMPPPPEHHDPYAGEDRLRSDDEGWDDDGTSPYPITWEREPAELPPQRLGLGRPGDDWPPRRRRGGWGRGRRGGRGARPRWLVGALVVAGGASVGAALVLTSGHSGGQASATRSPAPARAVRPPGRSCT